MDPLISICPACMQDWSFWGTLRKSLCVLGLAFLIAGVMPSIVIGQSPMQSGDQVRLSDLERRAEKNDSIPERIASLEQKVSQTKDQVDALNTRAWFVLVAALAAFLDRMLGAFGIRIRDRKPED